MHNIVKKIGNVGANPGILFPLKKSVAQGWGCLGAFLVVSTQLFASSGGSETRVNRFRGTGTYGALKFADRAGRGSCLGFRGGSLVCSFKALNGSSSIFSQGKALLSPWVEEGAPWSALGCKIALHAKGVALSAVYSFIEGDQRVKGVPLASLSPRGQTLELSAGLNRVASWLFFEKRPLNHSSFGRGFISVSSQFKGHFFNSRGCWALHHPLSKGWWLSFSQGLGCLGVKRWKVRLARLVVNDHKSLLDQLSSKCSESHSDSGSEPSEEQTYRPRRNQPSESQNLRNHNPSSSSSSSASTEERLRWALNEVATEEELEALFCKLHRLEQLPPRQGRAPHHASKRGKKTGRASRNGSLPSDYFENFNRFRKKAEALGWSPERSGAFALKGSRYLLPLEQLLKKWVEGKKGAAEDSIRWLRRDYEENHLSLHRLANSSQPVLILEVLSRLVSEDFDLFKTVFFTRNGRGETLLHIIAGNSKGPLRCKEERKLLTKKLARLFELLSTRTETFRPKELLRLLSRLDEKGNHYLHNLAGNRGVGVPRFLGHIQFSIPKLLAQTEEEVWSEVLIPESRDSQGRTILNLFCSKNYRFEKGELDELVYTLSEKISLVEEGRRVTGTSTEVRVRQGQRWQSLLVSQDNEGNTYLHCLAKARAFDLLLNHLATLKPRLPTSFFLEWLDLKNDEGVTIGGVIEGLKAVRHCEKAMGRFIAASTLPCSSSSSSSSGNPLPSRASASSLSNRERTGVGLSDEENREEIEEEREEILPSLEAPNLEAVENTRLVSSVNNTEAGSIAYRILERLFERGLTLETSFLFSLFSGKRLFVEFGGENLLTQLIQGAVPEKGIEESILVWFQELLSRNELGLEKCLALLEYRGGRGENIIHQLLTQENSTNLMIFESVLGVKERGVLAALLSQQNEAGATPLRLALSEGRNLQAREIRKSIQALITEGELSESKSLELLKNQRDDQGGNILHLSLRSKKELFGPVRSKEEFSEFVAALLGMLKVDSYLELILEEDSNHRKPLQLSLDRNDFTFFNALYNLETTQNVFSKLLEAHADPEIGGNFLHALVVKLGKLDERRHSELEAIVYKVLDYLGKLWGTDLPYKILSETTNEGEEILSLALSRWGRKCSLHPLINRVIDFATESAYFPEDPRIGAKLFEKGFSMKTGPQLNSTYDKLLRACTSVLGPDKFFGIVEAGSKLWADLFASEQGVALLRQVTEILWDDLVAVVGQVFPYGLFKGRTCEPVAGCLSAVQAILMKFNVKDPRLDEWLKNLEKGRKKFQLFFHPDRSHYFEGLKERSSEIELKEKLNEIFSEGTSVFRTLEKLAYTFFGVGPVGHSLSSQTDERTSPL